MKASAARFGANLVIIPDKGYWNRAEAINAGFGTVKTPMVFFSDVDIVYSKGFFEEVIQILDEDPLSYVISAMNDLPEDHPIEISNDNFGELLATARPRFGASFHAAMFGARTEIVRLVGGYDENYLIWGTEDDD